MRNTTVSSSDPTPFRVLSLGAGVQSTTIYLMSMMGQLDRLDAAIFADTQWEPAAVYRHLEWLEGLGGAPIHRVSIGSLRDQAFGPEHFAAMPLHVRNVNGDGGMARRQCTTDYKVLPIRREVRRLIGRRTSKGCVEQWLGISLDEAHRMRDSDVRYITLRYPLIDRRMRRSDCLRWLREHSYPEPPRSACIGCPFHADGYWRQLKIANPAEFADAVDFDRGLRDGRIRMGSDGISGQTFLHRSLVPLEFVPLTGADTGQQELDGFGNECAGVCGV